jgi:ubiquinone/menaquinone biosynthesis C-methylase UbiE
MGKIDHFKYIAPYYDSILGAELDLNRISYFDVKPGSRLLDAGGGTGRVSGKLDCQDCDIVIVDESFNMLRQAAEKKSLKAVKSVIENLPFPNCSMDRIIMVDVLHHVANQWFCAREMWRIIKPGGKIIIEEPDIHFFPVKILALAEKALLMRSHFLSDTAICRLFPDTVRTIQVHKHNGNIWIIIQK